MFAHKTKYLKFDAMQVWLPQSVQEVLPILNQSPVVMLWQCPQNLVEEFRSWTFRTKAFQTPLIDLLQTEEELWQKLEPKSCRYEVRKAQKFECTFSINEDTDAARVLLNESINRLQYRHLFTEEDWKGSLHGHDIVMCRWQGIPVAVHMILRDFPGRARLILSATEDRSNERFRGIVGPCNRLLHWYELQAYKAKGYRYYDFGGCDLNKEASEYPITQFKMSFGGEVVSEPIVYLAKNPSLRAMLRGMGKARKVMRKIPWPKSWIKKLRTTPKIGDVFR